MRNCMCIGGAFYGPGMVRWSHRGENWRYRFRACIRFDPILLRAITVARTQVPEVGVNYQNTIAYLRMVSCNLQIVVLVSSGASFFT